MTFGELQAEVLRRLGDSSSAPEYFTASDVKASLNDAYTEMSDASEWYERNAVLKTLSNRTYYDLRGVLGAETFLGFRSAFNNTTRRWLDLMNVRELDEQVFQQWENVTGEPESVFLRGLWWLGTFPKQASDTGSLKVYFSGLPPELKADSDQPGFPEEFHEGLIEYALGDLFSQDWETRKAVIHFNAYSEIERALTAWVDGRIAKDRISRLHG